MYMLLHYFFDEIMKESTASTIKPVDFAVKLGIIEVAKVSF